MDIREQVDRWFYIAIGIITGFGIIFFIEELVR